ncbi:MAG: hypothetical protein ACJ8AH_10895, partial [Stellaceae bacterium]
MPTNISRGDFTKGYREGALDEPPVRDEDVEDFKSTLLSKLTLAVGKNPVTATDRDWFVATSLALRDRVIHRWLEVERLDSAKGRKRVYYLS